MKPEVWSIGHYCGDDSICVNLAFDGKHYHRHDYGVSPIPRFIRLGTLAAFASGRNTSLMEPKEKISRAALSVEGIQT